MPTDTKKIGELISEVRKQRGLTQTELAQKLGTSQSAVNRIERGKQNLSVEMLARISDVLNRELLRVNESGSINFRVRGGKKLKGSITVKSSKNATMALLAASLLNSGSTTLENVPKIEEVNRILEVLRSIGVTCHWENDLLIIKPPKELKLHWLNEDAARKTRSILLFLAPLMHRAKSFTLPYAGGCDLGKRTIKPHLYALSEFGMEVNTTRGRYHVNVRSRAPGEVTMYEMSDTATENALMAAAKTPGKTVIRFASHNYMVRDLCYFLQDLGVKIEGIGTNTLTVYGKDKINKNITYSIAEDPIEAMMFISAAVTTNSSIVIKRAPLEFLRLELLKLEKMGWKYKILRRYKARNGRSELADIKTYRYAKLSSLDDKLHALPFPGINMDNLPFFVPIAASAAGRTLIHDWSYENRAIYFTELNKLGANTELLDPHRLLVQGPTKWRPAEVVCPPALRPAVIVLIGMLAAPGLSTLRNIYSIARGYEDLAMRLNSLGADIEVMRDI